MFLGNIWNPVSTTLTMDSDLRQNDGGMDNTLRISLTPALSQQLR